MSSSGQSLSGRWTSQSSRPEVRAGRRRTGPSILNLLKLSGARLIAEGALAGGAAQPAEQPPLELKRFLEQQISVSLEATRRTSSGISRNQDRDRLHFYQQALADVKAGKLDQAVFEKRLRDWKFDRPHGFALETQSLPEALFRDELIAAYGAFNPAFRLPDTEPRTPLQRAALAGASGVAIIALLAIGLLPAAIVADVGPFEDGGDDSASVASESDGDNPDTTGEGDEDEDAPPEDAPIQRIIVEGAEIDNSAILTLGLQPDGSTFEVPTNATQVAWYDFSGLPGEDDKSPILAAHVSYRGQRGVFFDLTQAEPGTFIYLVMADGTAYKYEVVFNRDIAKTVLTWEDLGCDPTQCFAEDAVTLVTCGGSFNPRTRSYNDNVVVRAELVETLDESEIPSA